MIKSVALVSLSSGIIGESYVKQEIDLGLSRLKEFGLNVKIMPHAMKGIEYVKNHPEDRAADLLEALADDSIDMILCAIGGDDTYRLLPYLFDNDELKNAVKEAKPGKIFLGFSDTTINHLMLHKLGFNTFYGQAFLPDLCEMDKEMLPYSKKYFEELIHTGSIAEIHPSDVWYDERTDFSPEFIGVPRVKHENRGFELLQGASKFSGEILGGCIDTLYDIFDNTRYADSVEMCRKYNLFPDTEDWRKKILLLETSEERPSPDRYRAMLNELKKTGIFKVISGIICGKPQDEVYFDEYKKIIKEVVDNPDLPIAANISIGHATPRCIIPFGVKATVDVENQVITFG